MYRAIRNLFRIKNDSVPSCDVKDHGRDFFFRDFYSSISNSMHLYTFVLLIYNDQPHVDATTADYRIAPI